MFCFVVVPQPLFWYLASASLLVLYSISVLVYNKLSVAIPREDGVALD